VQRIRPAIRHPIRIRLPALLFAVAIARAQTNPDWWHPKIFYVERDQAISGRVAEFDAGTKASSSAITRARVTTIDWG